MMGRLERDQGQLFYSFCLDEAVPADHRAREIAAVLDLSWVHAELAPHYSHLGRPSIDPVLMIRMLILGYVFAIRSERLLCREVQVNLAYQMVLRPEHRGQDPGPLGVLARPQRALPRQRHLPARVRARGGGVHRGGPGRRRRLRGRCQPDRGGRQQAALDPGQRLGQEARPGDGEPGREGVSCNPRRCGLRRRQRCGSEVRLTLRSGGAVDGCDARTGLLRLCRQLPDRREVRHHHGCGSLPRHPPGRGGRRQDHDRAYRGALRPEAGAIGRRYGLRLGRDARLDRQREGDRPAHPGDRQIQARRTARSHARTSPSTRSATSISARRSRR